MAVPLAFVNAGGLAECDRSKPLVCKVIGPPLARVSNEIGRARSERAPTGRNEVISRATPSSEPVSIAVVARTPRSLRTRSIVLTTAGDLIRSRRQKNDARAAADLTAPSSRQGRKGVAHAHGTAERTQPSRCYRLNRRSTARPGPAEPLESSHRAVHAGGTGLLALALVLKVRQV